MKILLRSALLLLATLTCQSADVRMFNTLADLAAWVPSALSSNFTVRTYDASRPFSTPRQGHYDPSSTATTNLGCVFATSTGIGRNLMDDCESGEIDVRYFGGAGDGVTDNTAAIQAAIEACSQSYTNGSKRLRIPTGDWVVNGPLRLTNNLSVPFSITGDGQQVTLIRQMQTNSPTFVLCGYGRTIERLRVVYDTPSSSPDGVAFLFVSRNGVGNGFCEVREVNANDPGIAIAATINNATVPITTPATAGSTNIVIDYTYDTGGQFVYREAEIIIPLAGGGSQTVVVQGTVGGTNVLFQPALTDDSTSGSVTVPGQAQNMAFRTIRISGPGYMGINWRTSDSGSMWENIYLSGISTRFPVTGGNIMAGGKAWQIFGASQMSLVGINNVEWCGVTNEAVLFGNYGTSVDSLHIEGIRLLGSDASFIRVAGYGKTDIQSLEIANHSIATNCLRTAVFRVDDGTQLQVSEFDFRSSVGITNYQAQEFYLVRDSGLIGGLARVDIDRCFIAKDSGFRYRAPVHPTSNNRVLRSLGDIIPKGTLAMFRNIRLDGFVGPDLAISMHTEGIPESIMFTFPSVDVSGLVFGIHAETNNIAPLLSYGAHLSGMSSWTNSRTIRLGNRPLVNRNLYLSKSNSFVIVDVNTSTGYFSRYYQTASELRNIAEIETPAAHGLQVGQLVYVEASSDPSYTGTHEVLAVTETNKFQFYSYGDATARTEDPTLYVGLYPTITATVTGHPVEQLVGYSYGASYGTGDGLFAFGTNIVAATSNLLTVGTVTYLPGESAGGPYVRSNGTWQAANTNYLPLSGGTLTGPLTARNITIASSGTNELRIYSRNVATNYWSPYVTSNNFRFYFSNTATGWDAFTFNTNGSLTSVQGTFWNTGTELLYSQTNLYDDLQFNISTLNPTGPLTGPTIVDTSGRDGDGEAAVFNTGDVLQWATQMPHTWVTNTTIYPHLHIEPQTADAITNTWIIKYSVADIGQEFPTWTLVTNTVVIAASNQWKHQLIAVPTNGISMTGKSGPSTVVRFRASLTSNVDTHVLSADVHYRVRGSPVAYVAP